MSKKLDKIRKYYLDFQVIIHITSEIGCWLILIWVLLFMMQIVCNFTLFFNVFIIYSIIVILYMLVHSLICILEDTLAILIDKNKEKKNLKQNEI